MWAQKGTRARESEWLRAAWNACACIDLNEFRAWPPPLPPPPRYDHELLRHSIATSRSQLQTTWPPAVPAPTLRLQHPSGISQPHLAAACSAINSQDAADTAACPTLKDSHTTPLLHSLCMLLRIESPSRT